MSGRKNFVTRRKITSAGDMSLATVASSVLNISCLDNIGIQVNVLSGSPNGSVAVQVSADYDQDAQGTVLNAGNWVTLTSQTISSGSPAQTYFDVNQLSSLFLRVLYTKTSGTGSFDVWAVGKMV